MAEHYLSKLFAPNSVAVFGASDDPQSMGAVVYANLVGGGFAGAVHPINIRSHTLNGR
jgi:acetyltransferase